MRHSKLTWFLAGIVGFALSVGAATAHAQAGAWTGNLNLSLGMRHLDNDWDPVDDQFEYGIGVDMRQRNWPVSLAVGLSHSVDDSGGIEADLVQFDVGVKKIYDTANLAVTPFAGAGLAFLWADVENEDDTALGLWLSGGAFVTVARNWNLGAEVKLTFAQDMDFGPASVDTSSFHWAVLAGYHW
jgi:hypothetical protein